MSRSSSGIGGKATIRRVYERLQDTYFGELPLNRELMGGAAKKLENRLDWLAARISIRMEKGESVEYDMEEHTAIRVALQLFAKYALDDAVRLKELENRIAGLRKSNHEMFMLLKDAGISYVYQKTSSMDLTARVE